MPEEILDKNQMHERISREIQGKISRRTQNEIARETIEELYELLENFETMCCRDCMRDW